MASITNRQPIFIVLNQSAVNTAERFRNRLGRGEIHGFRTRVENVDVLFENTLHHIADLNRKGHPIIAFCAVPIIIRAVGAHLPPKKNQQPIMAISEDGCTIIPLLGIHSGTHSLAQRIKDNNSTIALTNLSDTRLGIALDDPAEGFVLGNPQQYKTFSIIAADKGIGKIDPELDFIDLIPNPESPLCLKSSIKALKGNEHTLIYHPKKLVLGVGCERGCSYESLRELVFNTLKNHNLSPSSIAVITSIELKKDEPAIHKLAAELNVPARFFERNTLNSFKEQLKNPSQVVFEEVGVYGVAEAAALSIENATLLVEKHKNKHATCAIGLTNTPITHISTGSQQGVLHIIGTGPGRSDWLLPEVNLALDNVTDLVGYSLYIDLLEHLSIGKVRHDFELGGEIERCQHALKLASEGKKVALVCSGDPGIYAMATLVYEVLAKNIERDENPEWQQVHINIIPGISAFQAASALAGAPIGHDFCTISLSDLLTPWQQIEKRIHAAAEGDFVVAFYNPVSLKRDWQLNSARDILLQHRPSTTPVILGRNLGREEEHIRVISLGELDAKDVDMLTLVMVGSSQSTTISHATKIKVYTPRGYAKKDALS